jgi:hypothetical protein
MVALYLVLLAFSISSGIALTTKQAFVRRLRALYPTTWERLRRPAIFPEGLLSSFVFARFIFRGEFDGLADPRMSTLGRWLRISSIFYAIFFILFVAFVALKSVL